MNGKKNILVSAAQTADLPADIIAGLPRVELTGSILCSIEPHRGLLAYSRECVCVDSTAGKVLINGSELDIRQMNCSRISVSGQINEVKLEK